jgi:methylmalonyl-CoA carboxyltransferase small subunit
LRIQISIDGTIYEVEVEDMEDAATLVSQSLPSLARTTIQSTVVPTAPKPTSPSVDEDCIDESKICRSPMAGIVMRVHVQVGEELQVDDVIVLLEAMKMETKVSAPSSGKLKSVKVAPGDAVKLNQILIEFE